MLSTSMKLEVAKPVKGWEEWLIFTAELYMMILPTILFSSVITMTSPGDRWTTMSFFFASQYFGTLISLFIAPLVDNYKLHRQVSLTFITLSSITSVTCYATYFIQFSGAFKVSLLFLFLTRLVHPFFFSAFSTVLHTLTNPPRNHIFATLFSLANFLQFALHTLQFWFPTQLSTLQLRVAVLSTPILLVQLAAMLIKHHSPHTKKEKGKTFRSIACITRALPKIRTGKCFQLMLGHYNYRTVTDAKKTMKIFLILCTLSLNLCLLNIIDVPWIFQYTSSIRQGVSSWFDFNAAAMLLTGVLTLVVEYTILPFLKKISSIPILSLAINLGYMFSSLCFIFSLHLQAKADAVNLKRMDDKNARVFLYNAMDTYTYVLDHISHRVLIPPGSIQPLTLRLGDSQEANTLTVLNFFNNAKYKMYLSLEPLSSTAYVLTCHGYYQIPAMGLVRQSTITPKSLAHPTLSFLCPTELRTGKFFPWCNATVTVYSKKTGRVWSFNLLLKGNGSSADLISSAWGDTLVNVTFNSESTPIHSMPVRFQPSQGGKYVLFVWGGLVNLRVKYRVIEVLSPFTFTYLMALPQIFCRALAVAFTQVALFSLVQINVCSSFISTTWAFVFHSEILFFPAFVVFLALQLREWNYQIFFVGFNLLSFIFVVLGMRVARYK